MRNQIEQALRTVKPAGITNIHLLALVTGGSSEVVFFGDYEGETVQSNEMAERDILKPGVVDRIYQDVKRVVRDSPLFRPGEMNIVTYDEGGEARIRYADRTQCNRARIKDEWIDSLPQ